MSDFFPYGERLPHWMIPSTDAVPMTKAETIMRREEAVKLRWPLFSVVQRALLMRGVPESELFYGGSPGLPA